MFRRIAVTAATLGLCATMLPAHAAKTTTLYFANPADSDFTPVLQTSPDDSFHETSTAVVVNGEGLPSDDTYVTGKKLSFKVDVSRHVTGTIHAMCQQVIGVDTTTQRNGGYVDLDATIKLDTTTLGTVTVSGPVAPTMTVSKGFDFKIPASLKNKTVKKVSAMIHWKTTVGLCSISYSEPGAATIVVPVK